MRRLAGWVLVITALAAACSSPAPSRADYERNTCQGLMTWQQAIETAATQTTSVHGTAAPPSDVPVQDSLRTMSQASVAFRTALNHARVPADAEQVHALLVRLTTSAQTLSDRAAAIIDAYSLNKTQQELDKALANNADAKAQFDHDTLTDDDLSRVAAYMSDQQCKDAVNAIPKTERALKAF